MRKRKKHRILTAMVLAFVLTAAIPVSAGTIQEEIDAASTERQEINQTLVSTEERLAALTDSKGDTEAYLAELSRQLSELSAEMTALEEAQAVQKSEIARVEAELDEARRTEAVQYEAMKLRIRYIYEASTSAGALEALFSADSFMDFLNRAEEMSQLTRYDREMLESYEQTITAIEEKENALRQEQQRLEEVQRAREEQQAQIEAVYEAAYREFEGILQSLEDTQSDMSALIEEIRRQEEILNQLLERKYAEEAAMRAAAQRAAAEAAAQQAATAEAAAQAAAAQAAAEAAAQAAAEAAAEAAAAETSAGTSAEAGWNPVPEEAANGSAVPEESLYVPPASAAPAAADPQPAAEASGTPAAEASGNGAQTEAPSAKVSDSGEDLTYLGYFTLTAYCSCPKCCGKWAAYAGLTASGATCQEGVTVAMGGVPFGTQLMINGHVYTVQDRGTPYGHVDIYFSTHEAACAFGMKYADVYQVN